MRSRALVLATTLFLAPISPDADAGVISGGFLIADSVLQFSGTQGKDGWFYGTWTRDLDGYQPSEFVQFTPSDYFPLSPPEIGAWWTPPFNAAPWTVIFADRQHSETAPDVWTVRRWVSPFAGTYKLTGHIGKHFDGIGGDGTRGIVYVDGVKVHETTLSPTDTVGVDYEVTIALSAGSTIDLVLDPLFNDALDTTVFTLGVAEFGATGPSYGSGCPGSGGFVPRLRFFGSTAPGSNPTMTIDRCLGGTTTIVYFGSNQAAIPIGYGCTLNVIPLHPFVLGPIALNGSGPGNGSKSVGVSIPSGFPPTVFTLQAFVSDGGAPGGVTNSNGWILDISP